MRRRRGYGALTRREFLRRTVAGAGAAYLTACESRTGHETNHVRFARQIGIGYLPLHVLQAQKLVEQHARALGHASLSASFAPIGSPSAMHDLLLSGNADIMVAGFAPFMTIWDKTRRAIDIRALISLHSQQLLLNTNNPHVQTVRDFTDRDRIAVPAIKVSAQATLLQMIAENEYGRGHHEHFDPITVELQHPDAYKALIAGRSQISAHFGSAPLQYVELSHPTIHRVASSYDATKGPSTGSLLWTTRRYYEENPKTIRAVISALDEARQFIAQRPRDAARIYMSIESEARGLDRYFGPGMHVHNVEDFVVGLITGPDLTFEPRPTGNVLDVAEFMHRVGRIKNMPAKVDDLFFEVPPAS